MVYVLHFLAFGWEHEEWMCTSEDLFPASSIPILTQVSMAGADLTPPHKPSAAHL